MKEIMQQVNSCIFAASSGELLWLGDYRVVTYDAQTSTVSNLLVACLTLSLQACEGPRSYHQFM